MNKLNIETPWTPNFYVTHNPPITLSAEVKIDENDLRKFPAQTEIDIRNALAIKLAEKLIEEDLITIEVDQSIADPLCQYATARAKIKIIQE